MQNSVKILSSKAVYKGRWVTLYKDEIIKPDGNKAIHEVAKRNDSVLVVAKQRKRLCLIKQYRFPANEILWEFPTGFINKNENPRQAAVREFEEEVGLIPSQIKRLGSFWTWPGFSTQKTYVFFADKFKEGKTSPDETEVDIEAVFIQEQKLFEMIKSGIIRSSTTLAALSLLRKDRLLDTL